MPKNKGKRLPSLFVHPVFLFDFSCIYFSRYLCSSMFVWVLLLFSNHRYPQKPALNRLLFVCAFLCNILGKGGKNRRRGKNEGEIKRELIFKEDGQEYAQVLRMLGNGRLEAQCFDGEKRLAHIRGKLRKKVWVNQVQHYVSYCL